MCYLVFKINVLIIFSYIFVNNRCVMKKFIYIECLVISITAGWTVTNGGTYDYNHNIQMIYDMAVAEQ